MVSKYPQMFTYPRELFCETIATDLAVYPLEEYTLKHSDMSSEIPTSITLCGFNKGKKIKSYTS